MPRSLPPPPPSPAIITASRRRTLLDLEISVVTPLFGGGAVPRETDPEHPVRAASVRGHLRFWWRACRSTAYQSPSELFAAESAVWGNTERPSAISVSIETKAPGQVVSGAAHQSMSYALFPFQGASLADGRMGVRFRLVVSAEPGILTLAQQHDVRAALWAWLTFGGIGARTRRGCGSLYCNNPDFAPPSNLALVRRWLTDQSTYYLSDGKRTLPIPALKRAGVVLGQPQSPIAAWMTAVGLMRDFRQGIGIGRDPDVPPANPGRSRWPEADSVRDFTHDHAAKHPPKHPARSYFPRADLGLPIILHFKDFGDPKNATLQATGDGATRMASPIILKPLALSANNAVPLALCLDAPRLWSEDVQKEIGVEVRTNKGTKTLSKSDLNDPERNKLTWPLKRDGKGFNARYAFLLLAEQRLETKMMALP